MLLSRILTAVGRTFITIGVLMLLFVAYQLWGTGILTAQAQSGLRSDFQELLSLAREGDLVQQAAPLPTPTPAPDVAVPAPTTDPAVVAAEEAARQAAVAKLAALLWQPPGEVVARLRIPAIGVDEQVVEGVGTNELRKGPGHYGSTPLPGMAGNASIAGHRTTWGAPFNRINELRPGDEISVETLQGLFTYRVLEQDSGNGFFVVPPNRVDVLDQDFAETPNRLTLTACHPKYTARQRIIVVAELVGEPAAYIARPGDAASGSSGLASEDVGEDDPSTVAPTAGTDDGAGTVTPTTVPGDPTPADEPTPEPAATVSADDHGAEVPAEDFGEGLNGDKGAVWPTIAWGFAAAAIWLAAAFIGRRWRKWPAYAIGVAPFALVLFICFVHLDRALPSY